MESCSRCAAVRDPDEPAALTWSFERENGETRRLCPVCTRDHARDIDARLPEEWWG